MTGSTEPAFLTTCAVLKLELSFNNRTTRLDERSFSRGFYRLKRSVRETSRPRPGYDIEAASEGKIKLGYVL